MAGHQLAVGKSRRLATLVANTLQALYENNRVPETWGTPSVSRQTFALLREEGVWVAGRYILQRLRMEGLSELSTVEKLTALVLGVSMVTLANLFLKQEKKPEITVREVRTFSVDAPKIPVTLYTLGAALLVAASEGSSSAGEGDRSLSYPGSDTSTDYRAYGRPDGEDGNREVYDTDAFDRWSSGDDSSLGQS